MKVVLLPKTHSIKSIARVTNSNIRDSKQVRHFCQKLSQLQHCKDPENNNTTSFGKWSFRLNIEGSPTTFFVASSWLHPTFFTMSTFFLSDTLTLSVWFCWVFKQQWQQMVVMCQFSWKKGRNGGIDRIRMVFEEHQVDEEHCVVVMKS